MGFVRYFILFGFYLSLASIFYSVQNKTFRPSFDHPALQPPVTSVGQKETIGVMVGVALATYFTPKRWLCA